VEDDRHQPGEDGNGHGAIPPEERETGHADAADVQRQQRYERKPGQKQEEQSGAREPHDGRIIANRGRIAASLIQ
jgi:hypothetical protein